ncbi:MAG: ABC-type transport auxiliary lipoprotein family protein [Oxalobacteraceae bacterium]
MHALQKNGTGLHIVLLALLGALMSGCATRAAPLNLYDFGPLPAASVASAPVSIAAIRTPTALNNQLMLYRLAYVNDLQPRSYAGSRWSMAPAQLLEQRLKGRLAQAGTVVLSSSEGANTLPLLRIEVDEMIQNFSSPQQSQAQLALRATLFVGRTVLAQKSLRQQAPAASADAAGGARAMADASDALIGELIAWLAAVPLPK